MQTVMVIWQTGYGDRTSTGLMYLLVFLSQSPNSVESTCTLPCPQGSCQFEVFHYQFMQLVAVLL